REYIMWQALWKGEFIGYQKAKNGAKSGARVPVYVEFYKYEIPDELMAKYSFSNKTIYFYIDYVSRRLINVMADKPYIDFAKTGEPEIRPVDSLRSPALHIKDETVIKEESISTHVYTLSALQKRHAIARHIPDKDELCERWGYYYDEATGLFYENEEAWRKAQKTEPAAVPLTDLMEATGAEVLDTSL
ncbi:MAG: hypothetical protein Q8N76_07860, partial [Candidatus Omnitrophota bacterium]|nr:hypothetical protein [Candidatus Omnitrophota bacterium]